MAADIPKYEFATVQSFELRWPFDGPQPAGGAENAIMEHVRDWFVSADVIAPLSVVDFQIRQIKIGETRWMRASVRVAVGT